MKHLTGSPEAGLTVNLPPDTMSRERLERSKRQMLFSRRILLAHSYSTALQSLVTASPLKGTVQSIFSRAVNLQFDRRLVTLHACMTPCAPNGVVLPVPLHAPPLAHLQAGMAVMIEDEAFYFPDLQFWVSLQRSRPWNPRPSLVPTSCSADWLTCNLGSLVHLVINQGPAASLAQLALLIDCPAASAPPDASLLVQKAWNSSRHLLQAITAQQTQMAVGAAEAFIGLGPGLTPSGDDLLTGLIATTTLLSEALGMRSDFYQHFSSEVLKRAQGQTTLLSSNWIEYASRGEVSELLGPVLHTLILPDQPQRLAAQASLVLSSGATSGADLLVGVILGSQCLLAQRSREE
jgi:hypothetical protein